jgi:hypothetical protein
MAMHFQFTSKSSSDTIMDPKNHIISCCVMPSSSEGCKISVISKKKDVASNNKSKQEQSCFSVLLRPSTTTSLFLLIEIKPHWRYFRIIYYDAMLQAIISPNRSGLSPPPPPTHTHTPPSSVVTPVYYIIIIIILSLSLHILFME